MFRYPAGLAIGDPFEGVAIGAVFGADDTVPTGEIQGKIAARVAVMHVVMGDGGERASERQAREAAREQLEARCGRSCGSGRCRSRSNAAAGLRPGW